jgi:hypothetical protein
MAKRQTIGLGCTVTAKNHMAVAGWGPETVAFTATTPVVDGVDQPTYISEMNGSPCSVPLADAPAVIQEHLARWA